LKESLIPTVKFLISEEGGKVVDSGGPTNIGLTLKLMQDLHIDLDKDGDTDKDDLNLVTPEVVYDVFYSHFWLPIKGDSLPRGLDLIAGEFCYNSPVEAKALLTVCKTMETYTLQRLLFYQSLCLKNPAKYGAYEKGWYRRALRAYKRGLELQRNGG
jgi:lysozyme family protein